MKDSTGQVLGNGLAAWPLIEMEVVDISSIAVVPSLTPGAPTFSEERCAGDPTKLMMVVGPIISMPNQVEPTGIEMLDLRNEILLSRRLARP
jgi:hypothetical protein